MTARNFEPLPTTDPKLIEALRLLHQHTRGCCDAWALMGPHLSGVRSAILTMLDGQGRKIPRSRSGVTALEESLKFHLRIVPACGVDVKDQIREKAMEVLRAAPSPTTDFPATGAAPGRLPTI